MRSFAVVVVASLALSGQYLAAPAADPFVDVIVVMKSQVAPTVVTPDRRERIRRLEKALRDHADATQRGARDLLAVRRKQGRVTSVVPLWITNAIGARVRSSVAAELAGRPDVREVRPSTTIQAPSAAVATAVEPNVSKSTRRRVGPRLPRPGHGRGVDGHRRRHQPPRAGRTLAWRRQQLVRPERPASGHADRPQRPRYADDGGDGRGRRRRFVDRGRAGRAVDRGEDLQRPRPATSTASISGTSGCSTPTGTRRPPTRQRGQQLVDDDRGRLRPRVPAGPAQPPHGRHPAGLCCRQRRADGRGPASPANNPEALAVGCGRRQRTDRAVEQPRTIRVYPATYPQLVAPGTDIHTTDLYGGYLDVSGTSLAAPQVAGALALLLQASPGLSADGQQAALQAGAVDLGPRAPTTTTAPADSTCWRRTTGCGVRRTSV